MAGTEFNYVVNVDTSRVMGAAAEIRSQMGMALAGPTGFATPASGLLGGGAGMMGVQDFAGGAASGFAQMQAGLARPPMLMQGMAGTMFGSVFGGTFTNPAMAYTPHYGMIQADSQLSTEWLVHRYGAGAANLLRPPGVGAFEFARNTEMSFQDRTIGASHDAFAAARSTGLSVAGGMAGGMVTGWLGGMAGKAIGGAMFGAPGAAIGALAGDWFGYNVGDDLVGKSIQNYYAQIEQIGGTTQEMGRIIGSGRGMTRTAEYNLGVGARQAATDLHMDIQEMGEIMAGARQFGMLPSTKDPSELRTKARDLASAVDDVASILHESLGGAMSKMAALGGMGMGGNPRAAALNLIGMGASSGLGAEGVFQLGMAGAGFAHANLLSGSQGFGLFTGAAGGHGLSREELGMVGGVGGLAQTIGMTQMGQALSPMGDLQLLAATRGGALGNMMDVGASALGALGDGGDFIGNMVHFQTHKREMLRGVGAGGIRAMSRNQMEGFVDIAAGMGGTRGDWELFYAENVLGLNEVQAKGFVGGGNGGGGGGGAGAAYAAKLSAMQDLTIGQAARSAGFRKPSDVLDDFMGGPGEFNSWKTGGMLGAGIGAAFGGAGAGIGAVAGAAIGLGVDAYNWYSNNATDVSIWASRGEKADAERRMMAGRYDRGMAAMKAGYGYVEMDPEIAGRVTTADLSQTHLSADSLGPVAAGRFAAAARLGGLRQVSAGPGTIGVGGVYYSNQDVQEMARGAMISNPVVTQKTRDAAFNARVTNFSAQNERNIQSFEQMYGFVANGASPTFGGGSLLPASVFTSAANGAMALAEGMILGSHDPKLIAAFKQGGMRDPSVRGYIETYTGQRLPEMNFSSVAGVTLTGGAMAGMAETDRNIARFATENLTGGGTRAVADYGGAYMKYLAGFQGERVATGVGMGRTVQYGTTSALDFFHWQAQHGDDVAAATGAQGAHGAYGLALAKDPAVHSALTERARAKSPSEIAAANRHLDQADANLRLSDPRFVGLHITDPLSHRAAEKHLNLGEHMGAHLATVGVHTIGMLMPGFEHGLSEKYGESLLDITRKDLAQNTARPTARSKPTATRENAIGFGEQESAMASINRSLKQTEQALNAVNRSLQHKVDSPPAVNGDVKAHP